MDPQPIEVKFDIVGLIEYNELIFPIGLKLPVNGGVPALNKFDALLDIPINVTTYFRSELTTCFSTAFFLMITVLMNKLN